MTGMLHDMQQFLEEKITVGIKLKYTIICLGLGLIHFVFIIVFFMGGVMPLF